MTDRSLMLTIAVLGGTGKEGAGLAMRWALNGYRVIIGSRDAERGDSRAKELNEILNGDYLSGMSNVDAAREAGIVVLTVPYSAHRVTLESVRDQLSGKVLVDVTVPAPPASSTVHLPEGQSAALEAQALLGDEVRVVAAFQNIGFKHLGDPEHAIDSDVLVCGDDAEAKGDVLRLVDAAGMRGIDAGPLVNAIAVESLTAVLISINKTYKAKGAGLRITGIS
jgi:NADPH-dependent F420 reductase